MRSGYSMRKATRADLDTLVAFTLEEAREAEGADKDLDALTRGVRSALEDPSLATYWVAESDDGLIVASTSVVTEWSDWHGGDYWWVQSVYILPEHRGRGLVELILDSLADTARAAGALDLRLYAHRTNRRALEAYRRCGFDEAPYTIMWRRLKNG
jgi:GNAT superfamily N-acetyltransferase